MRDKSPLRALSLIVAVCICWQPAHFAANTSSLAIWQMLLMLRAVSAGMVHGVRFRLRRMRWQALFSPFPASCVLPYGLFYYFFPSPPGRLSGCSIPQHPFLLLFLSFFV
ncbi:cyd operon YbgE family protein [Erwinia psidii]|uniref:Cyd operon protein YbgE n=1 Tax=Erwinia psidii TaxID=69224 RepID=A0A3N6UNE2_9GAMM|nr:cyd operon protein YbgE [Erwinia psidii]MCX8961821.1 cyd operon protein YbgE [Erwinia psidii]MCX8965415.1 cyd operon protein YbgE [Erwinia psidii]RQM37459.1 cyd operon protein YbgE [Erwinia psidii]